MRLHAKPVALTLAATLALAGCSAAVDPAAKDPMKTVHGFCNSVQDAFVKLYERCGYPAAYIEPLVAQWRAGCVNMGASADAGRVAYDRTIGEQCLAAFDTTLRCDESMFSNVFSLCALATKGTVPPGGACHTDSSGFVSECAGGKCDSSATCPGVCVVPGQAGQPCASIYPYCAAGLSCVANATGPKTCKAPGGYNDTCNGPYDPSCNGAYYYCSTASTPNRCANAASTDGANCALTGYACTGYNNLRCVSETTPTVGNFCRGPAPIGGDCSARNCGAGAYCRYDAASTPKYTCRTIPSGLQPVGGDCYYNGNADCQVGLYCRTWGDYTCQAPLPIGAACTQKEECGKPWNTCAIAPTGTTGGTGACVATKPIGATCRAGYEECQPGAWCEAVSVGSTGVCRGLSGAGGKCGSVYTVGTTTYESAECAPQFDCNSGTCGAFLSAGAGCTYDSQCGAPWTGLACVPTVAGNSCFTVGNCTCAPNACSNAFGWLPW